MIKLFDCSFRHLLPFELPQNPHPESLMLITASCNHICKQSRILFPVRADESIRLEKIDEMKFMNENSINIRPEPPHR